MQSHCKGKAIISPVTMWQREDQIPINKPLSLLSKEWVEGRKSPGVILHVICPHGDRKNVLS